MNFINLWYALTTLNDLDDCGVKVTKEDLGELGSKARYHMQELAITTTEEGWLLRLFSAEEPDGEIDILIPADYKEPVRILKDRIDNREYHH